MRILVGTFEIGRHVFDLAAGLRAIGHEVDTVVGFRNPQHPDLPYDVLYDVNGTIRSIQLLQRDPLGTFILPSPELELFRRLSLSYDCYIFNFSTSLLPQNQDFRFLKRTGKRIIVIHGGSDVRHWSAAEPVAAAFGCTIPSMYREAPYDDLNARLLNMRMAERYADAIFSAPYQAELAIRPYWGGLIPIDLSQYDHAIPDREVPVIVHAPTRRGFKGTEEFLEVLKTLKSEGVRFELRLLEGISNEQVKRELVDADVVLDQLFAPHYGMLALEAMSTGCVVASCIVPGYVPHLENNPVYRVDRTNVYQRIKELLLNRELRREHARLGRAYVESKHEHKRVAAHVLSRLDTADPFDYHPSFFACDYQKPVDTEIEDRIRQMTTEIAGQWGLPSGVDVGRLDERGLAVQDKVDRRKPVYHWIPLYGNNSRKAWGWYNLPPDETFDEPEQAGAFIIAFVQHVLDLVSRKPDSDAQSMLVDIVEYAQLHPETLEEVDVIVALGRLAFELGQQDMAISLYRQVASRSPHRTDLIDAVEAIQSGTPVPSLVL